MLHLFNKTYLDFDDKISLNFDRVVISNINGVDILDNLQKVTSGKLIQFAKKIEDIDFLTLITSLNTYNKNSNKKIIIYCDTDAYLKFFTKWFKIILPNLDLSGFQNLFNITIYKERLLRNSVEQTVQPTNPVQINTNISSDIIAAAFNAITISADDRQTIKNLSLSLSFEYMLSDYFSGSTNYKTQLKSTVHLFLYRWFKDIFAENKEMVLYNLNNKLFQSALNFTDADLDLTDVNPIKNVASLASYADPSIWTSKFSTGILTLPNLVGLSADKLNGLKNTIINIFANVEAMEIDRNIFKLFDYLPLAAQTSLSDTDLDNFLYFVIANPFDTCLVPKSDSENVNYVFIQNVLNFKRNNDIDTLSKFKLL
jgi:hypothetical protein